MATSSMLKAKGLYTFQNYLSQIPEGSLFVANNVNIDRDGIIEPRRGIKVLGNINSFSKQLINYKNRILAHHGTKLSAQSDFNDGVFNELVGDIQEVDPNLRIKSIEMNGSLYVTSKTGIKKVLKDPNIANTYYITNSGGINALDLQLSLDIGPGSSTSGFFGPLSAAPGDRNVEVAYEVVWGTKDLNNTLILGKPSSREILTNTTGEYRNVRVSFIVPPDVTPDYFFQIYRTNVALIDGSGAEFKLVFEAPFVSGATDIINGYSHNIVSNTITLVDEQPEALRDTGVPLYTNEFSGEGILQANDSPPVARDIATYKNITFYANTRTAFKQELTFLGFDGIEVFQVSGAIPVVLGVATITTTAPHGIVPGDFFALAGTTNANGEYVAKAGTTGSTIIINVNVPTITQLMPNATVNKSYFQITNYNNTIVRRYYFVGRPEMWNLTVPVKTAIVNGDYFNITTADDKIPYTFWMDVSGAATAPVVANRVLVRVNLSSGAIITAQEVASAIRSVIESTLEFSVQQNLSILSISTTTSGKVDDPLAGVVVETGPINWSIVKTQDGFGEDATLRFVRLSSFLSPTAKIDDTTRSLVNVINKDVSIVFPFGSPNLGTAVNFATLASSTITNTGSTVITGNLGLSPGTSVTGFPPGVVSGIQHITNAAAAQAKIDANTAYTNMAALTGATNLSGVDLGTLTLAPGIYKYTSSAALTGTLKLDAGGNPNAVWIFQIGSTLTTASSSVVSIINGGSSSNVYWQVGSSATLGTNSNFSGTIIAQASVTATTGAIIKGNLIALTAAVTLDTNVVTQMTMGLSTTPNFISAFYLSTSPNSLPGAFLLQENGISLVGFTVLANNQSFGQMFSPNITTTILSSNTVGNNSLYFSKVQQPEAVPVVNKLSVGPQDKAILRIIGLRDSLFILKEEGIYRLTGETANNFSVALFDNSSNLIAADTAVVLNNQIYCLTTQGVGTISETGVGIISRPIENIINRITSPSFANYTFASFGVTYETDRSYLLFTIDNDSDVTATKCYRYNTFTQSWTSWDKLANCGIVHPTKNDLHLGATDIPVVEIERKSITSRDYADRQFDRALSNYNLTTKRLFVDNVTNIEVGDILSQIQYLKVTEYNRLIKKIKIDPSLSSYAAIQALSTIDHQNQTLISNMQLLVAALNVADISGSPYVVSGTNDFQVLQTEYNIIINKMNVSTGVFFADYDLSAGTVFIDLIITQANRAQNFVKVANAASFILGKIIHYKGIKSTVVWAPNALGNPSLSKHIREGTFLLENTTMAGLTVGYASDLSGNFEDIEFGLDGSGVWGGFVWSNVAWGGEGISYPVRTLIPRQKQRCRYIKARFKHNVAMSKFSILGISYTFEEMSERAWF